jgi:hypothetical protein
MALDADGIGILRRRPRRPYRRAVTGASVWTRFVLYGAVPFVAVGCLMIAYHSGVEVLRRVVAPDAGKEFGLLENLQNALLIAIAAVAILGLRRKHLRWERIGLAVLLAGSLFMLLEEIDYGFQYSGDTPVNVHELGSVEVTLEHIARFGGLTFFGGFAIVFAESANRSLRYLAPDRFAVLTILLVTACWEVAIRLPRGDGPLAGHEIEFAELGVDYLVLLYACDMVFRRTYGSAAAARDDLPAR